MAPTPAPSLFHPPPPRSPVVPIAPRELSTLGFRTPTPTQPAYILSPGLLMPTPIHAYPSSAGFLLPESVTYQAPHNNAQMLTPALGAGASGVGGVQDKNGASAVAVNQPARVTKPKRSRARAVAAAAAPSTRSPYHLRSRGAKKSAVTLDGALAGTSNQDGISTGTSTYDGTPTQDGASTHDGTSTQDGALPPTPQPKA